MKKCSKCNEDKEFSQFYKDKSKVNGYSSHCKSCIANRIKNAPPRKGGGSLYANLSPEAIERERRRKKQYKKDHPDVVAAIDKRQRAKRRLVPIIATSKETKQFMENNRHCVRCDSTDELTLDHIIPVSWINISRHALDNFQVLCNTCNGTKSASYSIDFRPIEFCVGLDICDLL